MKRVNVLKNCRTKSSNRHHSLFPLWLLRLIHVHLQFAIWNPDVPRCKHYPERNICSRIFYLTSSTCLKDSGTSKQTLSWPYNRLTHLSQIWFVLTWLSLLSESHVKIDFDLYLRRALESITAVSSTPI